MKRNHCLFQLQFNLLSLLLVIGLVAFISDRATLHGAQKIDENLKRVQQAVAVSPSGHSWTIEHLPSLIPSQTIHGSSVLVR
ncbi:MAG: hypothetical protein VYE64_00610 [Planctomycetota bacterium]|nr:hypothetical protein [Planctomycetota bacterium]